MPCINTNSDPNFPCLPFHSIFREIVCSLRDNVIITASLSKMLFIPLITIPFLYAAL